MSQEQKILEKINQELREQIKQFERIPGLSSVKGWKPEFTQYDMLDALEDKIFNRYNQVIASPSRVIEWFEEWAANKFSNDNKS